MIHAVHGRWRSLKDPENLAKRDVFRSAGKHVAAMHTAHGLDQPGRLQRADDVFEILGRKPLCARDVFDRDRVFRVGCSQLSHGPACVTGLCREKHFCSPIIPSGEMGL